MITRRTFVYGLTSVAALGILPQEDAFAKENSMSQEQAKQPRYGLQVKMTAEAGKRDELVEYLLRASRLVGVLPGCELYVVSVSPTDPESIWVYEVWRREADHDASLKLDTVRALIGKARPLIAGGGERTQLVPVGGKGL
jgi:quinol monooxygenase YgiN